MPDLQLEEVTLFSVDNFVCAQWRTRGTHTAELFGMPPTRRAVCFDTAEVYELDTAGLVRTSRAFGDPEELFRQLRAQSAGGQGHSRGLQRKRGTKVFWAAAGHCRGRGTGLPQAVAGRDCTGALYRAVQESDQ